MDNMRYLREKAGLTQGQLAKKMGVALDSISRYENGKREPRASDLRRMAEIFECTVDDLLNPTQPLPNREQGEETMG